MFQAFARGKYAFSGETMNITVGGVGYVGLSVAVLLSQQMATNWLLV